jgi:hypothetical protein
VCSNVSVSSESTLSLQATKDATLVDQEASKIKMEVEAADQTHDTVRPAAAQQMPR